MALPKDNRVILLVGAGVAIVIAVVLALIFTGGGDKTTEAPPASKGGLVVNLAEAPTLEPTRELRCFVDGPFVGMATLAACAQRNGLATDALDVGLDATGALAAAIAMAIRTLTWAVKALVEATPISGPACVGHSTSASRAIDDE